MTIEQFNNTHFCGGDKFKYQGEWHNIAALNLEEALVAFDMCDDVEDEQFLSWVRCENIEDFKPYHDTDEAIQMEIFGKIYYLHYTICDAMPGAGYYGMDEPTWKPLSDEESNVLDAIPMDGCTFKNSRGALEIPILTSSCQFKYVRVLSQKSDNNGCTVFACQDKDVLDMIVPEQRSNKCYKSVFGLK